MTEHTRELPEPDGETTLRLSGAEAGDASWAEPEGEPQGGSWRAPSYSSVDNADADVDAADADADADAAADAAAAADAKDDSDAADAARSVGPRPDDDRLIRPQPAPVRKDRDPGRTLRRFAGVDEDLLAWVPQERARYTGMGGAVLFTAIMAFLSMTVALGLAFSTRSLAILIPAAVWFVLILNFDRWLVSAPMAGSFWSKLPTLAVRMGMAVLFGIVIAEPLVLAVFNTAVHTQVLQSRADDLKAYQATWERCNPIGLTAPATGASSAGATPSPAPSTGASPPAASSPQCANFVVPLPENVKALQADSAAKQALLTSLQATLKPLTAQHDRLVKKSQDECLGRPGVGLTGQFGNGPVCRRLTQDAENYAKLNRLDDLEQNVAGLTNDLQSLSTQIRNASTQWAAQRAAYITARVNERAASTGKIGLLERIEALNTLARTHAALGGAIWAVRGLFILIDLAPALLKYTSGQTRYDRLVESSLRLGEERFNATIRTEMSRARLWADDRQGALDVERARRAGSRTAEYDQIMDDLERHWSTSAETASLSRPVRSAAPNGRGWPEATSRYGYAPDDDV